MVVLGSEHATEIAGAGFSRKDVKQYLFQYGRIRLGVLKDRGYCGTRSWLDEWNSQGDDFLVALVDDPDKLVLAVAGGQGRHSSWFPAWSATQRALEVIKA